MVQLRSECNCETCSGGEPAPKGSFGGWRCTCNCHLEKKKEVKGNRSISLEHMIRLDQAGGVVSNLVPPMNEDGEINWNMYDAPAMLLYLMERAYHMKKLVEKEWEEVLKKQSDLKKNN